jgi:hypothetical protein
VLLTAGWTEEAQAVLGCADLTAPGAALRPEFAGVVFPIKSVPHDFLFPRVQVIVTHGGAGTTHAALRAGKVPVFVPFGADQPWWGQLAVAKRLSPAVILHTSLTADNLTAAIVAACTQPEFARNCERVCTFASSASLRLVPAVSLTPAPCRWVRPFAPKGERPISSQRLNTNW